MKLAILGATGQTGLCLVKQALDKGYNVVAIVRNAEKIQDLKADNLKVFVGDIFSVESLHEAFSRCDAVLSCLGQAPGVFPTVTLYSESCKAIVAAMRLAGVRRFVCLTSWYTQVDPDDDPGYEVRNFVRPRLSAVFADMTIMEEYLAAHCLDIDFTSIRPPRFVDESSNEGGDFVIDVGRYFCDCPDEMTRADVARSMLRFLQTEEYNQKCVAIGISN